MRTHQGVGVAIFDRLGFGIYYKMFRHFDSLAHLNWQRATNLARMAWEIQWRKTVLRSKPVFLRINPISVCNLSCPMCSIGQQKLGIKPKESAPPNMTLDNFRKIVTNAGDNILKALLYDEGEPLLHPDISDMVNFLAERDTATVISTNFAMEFTDSRMKDLAQSGLSHLIVALDGSTQDIYSKYRIGGNIDIVQDNLTRFMAVKNENTLVELQFIRFGYNNHQLEDIRQFGEKLGVERFSSFDSIWHPDQKKDRDQRIWQPPKKRRRYGCFDIYAVLDVDTEGYLFPCDHGEDYGFAKLGSMLDNDLETLWNSPEMIELRSSFRLGHLPNKVCMGCHLETYLPFFLR